MIFIYILQERSFYHFGVTRPLRKSYIFIVYTEENEIELFSPVK